METTQLSRVLIISDNAYLCGQFIGVIQALNAADKAHFDFAYSWHNKTFTPPAAAEGFTFTPVKVKTEWERLVADYDIVFSIHCKQLFPPELVRGTRCYNVHPGLNPHNRGWFPQVFSLINGLPCGATLHEIDEHLDHGRIIGQQEVAVNAWDTSADVYNRVLLAETELLREHLMGILVNNYPTSNPEGEGNLNLKKDFDVLCHIDLNEQASYKDVINRLRALTHGNLNNAYFIDETTNKKVFIQIKLTPE